MVLGATGVLSGLGSVSQFFNEVPRPKCANELVARVFGFRKVVVAMASRTVMGARHARGVARVFSYEVGLLQAPTSRLTAFSRGAKGTAYNDVVMEAAKYRVELCRVKGVYLLYRLP